MKNSQYNFIIANIWIVGLIIMPKDGPWYTYIGVLVNAILSFVLGFWWQHTEGKPFNPSTEMLMAVRDHVNAEIKKRDL